MKLHDVLAANTDEVLRRWEARARATAAEAPVSEIELLDHMPKFLAQVIAVLRDLESASGSELTVPARESALAHGRQRLRLGFSLGSIVREYGALRQAIVSTAQDEGVLPTLAEMQTVFELIIAGIADAVSEYARERDADMARQANEHFAFIAHELRNPLGSVAVALELLKRQDQLPTEGYAVGALERGLRRLNELIHNALQVARGASGIELRLESTTLTTLVEDARILALPQAESKGIKLHASIENDREVSLDRRLVGSALDNLVSNGVKYSHPGGSVEIRASIENSHALFEVEDSCGGLQPRTMDDIFAPFVRMNDGEQGFGLGLAITRQAVNAHGGTIQVQNLPGKGCRFVMDLPIVSSPTKSH